MSVKQFNAVKVFSATMAQEREALGDKVTTWLERHPDYDVQEIETTQSSDEAFHCISILIFYKDHLAE